MIRLLGKLSLKLFKALSVSTYTQYIKSLDDPFTAQNKLLQKIISGLSQTSYGKSFSLVSNANYDTYCQQIPVVDYDGLAPWIEMAKSEKRVLTKNAIQFFELTSGSQGAKKSIPYTRELRRHFSNCFKIWGFDCLQDLTLESLKLFMSISPRVTHEANSSSLQDDSDYITGPLQWLVRRFIVHQPHIHQFTHEEDFRFILALTLLAQEDLEIISIWSPTYLLLLLSIIEQHYDEMLKYISLRDFNYKGVKVVLPIVSENHLNHLMTQTRPLNVAELWPQLALISCWRSATSVHSANKLQMRFPNTLMQGKGLLATEAPLTVPITAAKGYLPLLNEIFFEFQDKAQRIVRVHELKVDEEYEVIISHLSGLYRYRMGDMVRVTHWYKKTPCLEFMGRKLAVSDLVGEKLHERFVSTVLSQEPYRNSQCLCLVPSLLKTGQGQYILLTDNKALLGFENHLDKALSEAFHYQNARSLLQLLRSTIVYHPNMQAVLNRCIEKQGVAMGDQKSRILMTSLVIAQQVLHMLSQDTA